MEPIVSHQWEGGAHRVFDGGALWRDQGLGLFVKSDPFNIELFQTDPLEVYSCFS